MTDEHPSDRIWAAYGKTRPEGFPRDLMPGDCRACYDEHGATGKPRGVSVPRGVETVLRDLQARLNDRGSIRHVKTVLGAQATTDIRAVVDVGFNLKVGDQAAKRYDFILQPAGHEAPSTTTTPSAPGVVGVGIEATPKPVDIDPQNDPPATG
jgi:hypothetical protein